MTKKKNTQIENFYDHVNLVENTPQLGILGFLRQKLINFEEDRIETAIKMMPQKISSMLDVGSNDGRLLIEALNKYKKAWGVDLSEEVIKLAEKNVRSVGLTKKIFFKKANIELGLPFGDKSFDLVTCLAVIEHLFDPEKAIREIGRVLKKGGYAILEVPNIAWLPRRLALFFGVRPRTSWAAGWDGGHIAYFTFNSFKKLVEKCSFEVVKIGCSGVFAGFRYLWPPLLSGNIVVLVKKKNINVC